MEEEENDDNNNEEVNNDDEVDKDDEVDNREQHITCRTLKVIFSKSLGSILMYFLILRPPCFLKFFDLRSSS